MVQPRTWTKLDPKNNKDSIKAENKTVPSNYIHEGDESAKIYAEFDKNRALEEEFFRNHKIKKSKSQKGLCCCKIC